MLRWLNRDPEMQKWFARIAKREDVMLFITELLQEPGAPCLNSCLRQGWRFSFFLVHATVPFSIYRHIFYWGQVAADWDWTPPGGLDKFIVQLLLRRGNVPRL